MSKFVLIDSGHCRLTQGKRSPDGKLLEHEFNYDVSCRVRNHLTRHGVKAEVQLVVDASAKNEVNERVRQANAKRPDILVSIHANAAGAIGWDAKPQADGYKWNVAHGWEVFCYKMQGESLKLAQEIRKASIPALGLTDRGIKDGAESIGVIARTTMPAVLIEHAFYTNKAECGLLQSNAFRDKCAEADARGIIAYLGINWKEDDALKHSDNYEAVKAKYGFADDTMAYLERYEWADSLFGIMLQPDAGNQKYQLNTINYILGYEYGAEVFKRLIK